MCIYLTWTVVGFPGRWVGLIRVGVMCWEEMKMTRRSLAHEVRKDDSLCGYVQMAEVSLDGIRRFEVGHRWVLCRVGLG